MARTPRRLADVFCSEVRRSLSPILATPVEAHAQVATKTRRPRQKRPPVGSPRRSVRIAKGKTASTATKQQQVLIRKLCLANEGEVIGDEALKMYVELFSRPLSDAHIAAVLALFGWEPSVLPMVELPVELADAA